MVQAGITGQETVRGATARPFDLLARGLIPSALHKACEQACLARIPPKDPNAPDAEHKRLKREARQHATDCCQFIHTTIIKWHARAREV